MGAENNEKKRVYRTKEERIAELNKKIASYENSIEKCKQKIEAIMNPKPRGAKSSKMRSLIVKAKDAGLTEEQIAEKLGINLE